jgi:hypothetical protein
VSVEHRGALPASHRLHEYRIERVLGFGGFGITYLATDTNLNKLVAIKEYLPAALAMRAADASIMPSAGAYAADFRWGLERFVEEARALARFRHGNLVPVHRYFEANGTAYVVMEYERGERLDDFLKRQRNGLPQSQVMQLLSGLLDGLEAVHRAGYLHRDVKPSNIVLRADGTPVLLDFGAARQALGQRSHTVTAIVTPGYAPLEQYAGDGKQGPWTDLYAVGALAHRLIVGAPPPEATSRARNDPYRPLVQRKPAGYDVALLNAVDWALQVDEHERPQSVREFRHALEGRSASNAVVAIPPRRRRTLPFLFAGLALLFVLGGGFYLHQRQAEQDRQQAIEVQRQQEAARQAEQGRLAEQRAAAERAATEKAAAEKAAAEKAAAEKAAAEKAAAAKPPLPPATPAAMTSQRAAEMAREAAAKAREFAAQARRGAELGRLKAGQARDQAAAARQAAAAANAGRMEIAAGVVYRGGMKADKRDGLGVLTAPAGFRYEGQWRDNIVAGLGVSLEGETRDRYEGEYVAGKRQGHGIYHFADGLRYEGEFEQNRRTGHGITYAPNGASIEAKWTDGAPDNLAVVHDGKGMRYEGTMVERRFSGFGILFMPDGQRYEGAYREDMHNGYGVLYLPNGAKRSGLWQDGRLVKPD